MLGRGNPPSSGGCAHSTRARSTSDNQSRTSPKHSEVLRHSPKQHDDNLFLRSVAGKTNWDNANAALASFNSEFLKDVDFGILNSFREYIFVAGLSSEKCCQAPMLFHLHKMSIQDSGDFPTYRILIAQFIYTGTPKSRFEGNWHTFDTIDNKGNSFQTIKASDTLKHQPTVWHAHSHITRAVAAMDSCFCLIRPHQHGIADGQK